MLFMVHISQSLACEESSEPKSITASQRVKEFPEDCLEVKGTGKSKLFSAALERVFLSLTNLFVERQNSSFQDYVYQSINYDNR